MERIVLRHLSGSKANQVEEFPLNHFKELIFGRDPASTVKYDPDKDDLVGRQHAKTTQNPSNPTQFLVTDLNSRNGTYVNKQRIVGPANLVPGDMVQFGAGGPEFQFDTEPRAVRLTRTETSAVLAGPGGSAVPHTRVAESVPNIPLTAVPDQPRTFVGKTTVQRMITQTKKDSRNTMFIVVGALAVVIAIGAVALKRWDDDRDKKLKNEMGKTRGDLVAMAESAPMSAGEIADKYSTARFSRRGRHG